MKEGAKVEVNFFFLFEVSDEMCVCYLVVVLWYSFGGWF